MAQDLMNPELEGELRQFIAGDRPENSAVVFAGTGVNSALHNFVSVRLGLDRLLAMKEVHLISGGVYAYLGFYAHRHGLMQAEKGRMVEWERQNRRDWGVIPVYSFLHFLLNRARGKGHVFSGDRPTRPLKRALVPELYTKSVAELPANVRIWCYSQLEKKLVCISSRDPYWAGLSIADVATAAMAIPGLTEPLEYKGQLYSDADFCPETGRLRGLLKEVSANTLYSNMMKHGPEGNVRFVRPHNQRDGRKMMSRDFLKFIFGLPNPALAAALEEMFAEGRQMPE